LPTIDPDAPALLIWLPEDKLPTGEDFVVRPETWTLEHAALHAYEVMRDHNKVPWIKSGGRVLGPSEIRQISSALRALRAF
jgi:hypothetical protein